MDANMPIHLWQKVDIELLADNHYDNPYTDVIVWVDLKGPGFSKRVYGFWDGGQNFVVRVTAPSAGEWSWVSGSSRPGHGVKRPYGTV